MLTEESKIKLKRLLKDKEYLGIIAENINIGIRDIRSTCTHEWEEAEHFHSIWDKCIHCGILRSPF